MRTFLFVTALVIGACAVERSTSTDQALCPIEDQENGTCDPAGGWDAVRQYLDAYVNAVIAQSGPPLSRTEVQCTSGGCTVEIDYVQWTVIVVCGQPTGQPIVCSSRTRLKPSW